MDVPEGVVQARSVWKGAISSGLVSDKEIRAAYPVSTHTIEVETFVRAGEIPFTYLEKPYVLAPLARSEKVYLLREAMLDRQVIGIARVVMHTKEHLAALIPDGSACS